MKNDPLLASWEQFAAAALSGVASNPESGGNAPRDLAHWAAAVADAMIAERMLRTARMPLE